MLQSKPQKPRKRSVGAGKPARDPGFHPVDYQALAQFRYQLRKFLSFSKAAAYQAGLTPQQHQALLAIKGCPSARSVSIGDLAEFLLVRHHTAVELVDRMTRLGLLTRTVDDRDSRRILLNLTAKGEQKLQALSRIHLKELRTATPALSGILRSFRHSRGR